MDHSKTSSPHTPTSSNESYSIGLYVAIQTSQQKTNIISREQDILRFGLPKMPYINLKSALIGMKDNDDGSNGNFDKLPSWVPVQEVYVMGGRQDSSFFHKTIVGDYSNLPKEFSKQLSEYLFQKK